MATLDDFRNAAPPRLVAAGGGGATHGRDPALEDFLLSCLPPRPRIGYVGHASADDPRKIARIEARFAGLAQVDRLPLSASGEAAARWAEGLDAIYVGGGDTETMLALWRRTGVAGALAAAARRGVLVSGVSAGAACWFERSLFSRDGRDLAPLECLGVFAGSCCPHYSTEPARRPAFCARIADGDLPDGIAIDDGVAALVTSDGPLACVSARPGARAWRVTLQDGATRTEALPLL